MMAALFIMLSSAQAQGTRKEQPQYWQRPALHLNLQKLLRLV